MKSWFALVLVVLAILGWQELRVHKARQAMAEVLRATADTVPVVQVDDSTTVTRGLEGELLARDATIRRLTRDLKASTRAQLDLRLALDLAGDDLPAARVLVDSARTSPVAGGLTHYEMPFVLVDGDILDGLRLAGHVGLDQPGPDWLPSLAVQVDQLQARAGISIDLVEGPGGWRAIIRTSSPALSAGVTLAVQPRQLTWKDRFHPLAGLGIRDGRPQVLAGARLDPWGAVVSAGAGAVGVFVFKAF